MDESTSVLLSLAVILGASMVQGAIGFGFSLAAVPLLILFLPSTEAVAMCLVIGTALNLLLARVDLHQIVWREIFAIMPSIAAGSIAGMLLLKSFDGPLFKAGIGMAVLAMALVMLIGHSWKAGPGQTLRQTVGAASGILFGTTSMGGPPVVLYLTGRGLTKERLRGTLAVLFILGNLLTIAIFVASGLFSGGLAARSLLLGVAVIPGGLIGRALTSQLNHSSFRKLVLVSMVLLGVGEIILNLASL